MRYLGKREAQDLCRDGWRNMPEKWDICHGDLCFSKQKITFSHFENNAHYKKTQSKKWKAINK